MPSFTTRVPTTSASRYLQQLAKHWSHKFETRFTAQEGSIALPGATLSMTAQDDALALRLEGDDAARLRRVVEEHLDRFAFREAPLTYDWVGDAPLDP